MRAAGPIFSEAHRVIAPFADIARVEGPFISLYLETSPDVEQAAAVVDLRWKNARRSLLEQGAPPAIVEVITQHADGAETRGAALAVISTFADVVHIDHNGEPPRYELAFVAPLPRLASMIEWRQHVVPYVVVVADRMGADLTAWLPEGTDITTTVDAMDVKAVTKTQPGGWSQPRYQRRVENAWEASAEEVADVVMNMADEVRAKVVVVAGDVRAVELLRKALPSRVNHLVRVVEGSRAADGSKPALARAVKRMVKTVAAAETTELLRSFHEESGQADRASNGAMPTIEALSRAQVETLLVHDDPDDERVAWFGPLPEQLAPNRAAVSAMGAGEPRQGRLVDAAVRAALGTGAGVWIVPRAGGPADGLGAILRWS